MAKRKRMLDKRVHSKNLDAVIISLIESPRWKDALLQLEPAEQLEKRMFQPYCLIWIH